MLLLWPPKYFLYFSAVIDTDDEAISAMPMRDMLIKRALIHIINIC
jgi:hypothetical protein